MTSPYHQPSQQGWAETLAQQSHHEALYYFGEYAMFLLMWTAHDLAAGRVVRCATCFTGVGRTAQAYGQGNRDKCPDCFGTSFEGGYRARVIRPALFTERTIDITKVPRGTVTTDTVTIETTEDFTFQHGDYVVRQGDLRYQGEQKGQAVIRSGFGYPASSRSVGGTISSARLEDHTSVAYLIPPLDPTSILSTAVSLHLPPNLSSQEVTNRGPLLLP